MRSLNRAVFAGQWMPRTRRGMTLNVGSTQNKQYAARVPGRYHAPCSFFRKAELADAEVLIKREDRLCRAEIDSRVIAQLPSRFRIDAHSRITFR